MLRSSSVTVYPVQFPGEWRPGTAAALRAGAFLAGLARASGGRVFQPQASKELAAIYGSILEDLGSQYVIGYVSDNPERDGRFRRIALEVRRPGVKLRYRPGYQMPRADALARRKR